MPLQMDVFLLILRLLLIVLFYLFLMQVVIAIRSDLKRDQQSSPLPTSLGHLVIVDSGPVPVPPGTSFPLKAETTIGRSPVNDIHLPHETVSREHALMRYHNGLWTVQDKGSTTGTFVNEQPAREPLQAKVGDIVRIGYIRFQIRA